MFRTGPLQVYVAGAMAVPTTLPENVSYMYTKIDDDFTFHYFIITFHTAHTHKACMYVHVQTTCTCT